MSKRIDDAIAALRALPGLVELVSDVPGTLASGMPFRDWYAPLDKFTMLLDRMIGPEMDATSPSRAETISLLMGEAMPGWDLLATLLTLDILDEHPELLTLFVERLRGAISNVLVGEEPTSNRR